LGPSAHEFDGSARRWNTSAYADWRRRLDTSSDPMEQSETLTDDNRAAERIYLGLRTTDGLVLSGAEIARVQPWVAAGWAAIDSKDRITLTALGWLRLDALAADLTLVRSHY
jgi:oxygen-independent coproporphyrinogen-3 oxidase